MKTRTLPILAAVLALAVTRDAIAETAPCAVPGDHATIQAALDDAHCDRVNIAAGTYPGNFTVSHSMTIVGAGAGKTILDGQNAGRVVTIVAPADLVLLSGLTIQHGNAKGPGVVALWGGGIGDTAGVLVVNGCDVSHNTASVVDNRSAGGGIFSSGGDLAILNSTITFNSSGGYAGGIDSENGETTILDSTIASNVSRTEGGGVDFFGNLITITRSQILNNTSTTSSGGGVDDSSGPLVIDHCLVANNHSAENGGGIHNAGNTLQVFDSTIDGNTAGKYDGAGIHQQGSGLSIVRSTVSHNHLTSGDGAGIAAEIDGGVALSIVNSTITGNTTGGGRGGGIYVGFEGSTIPSILDSTISGNSAATGGGLFGEHLSVTTTSIAVENTILAGNTGKDCGPSFIASLGHNLSGDSSCPFTAAGDLRATDPKLGSLALAFPGDTATFPLLPGSPAIDAGNDAHSPLTDQRGIPRRLGAHSDIGAFEVVASPLKAVPLEDPIVLRTVDGR